RVCPCREGVFPVDEGLVHGGCQALAPPVRGISNSRNCGDSTGRVNTFGGFARNGWMTCSVRFDSDRAHSGIENDQGRRFLGRLRLLTRERPLVRSGVIARAGGGRYMECRWPSRGWISPRGRPGCIRSSDPKER